jgi:hypothetical protein
VVRGVADVCATAAKENMKTQTTGRIIFVKSNRLTHWASFFTESSPCYF